MDSTLDRLRRLQKLRPQRKSAEPLVASPTTQPEAPRRSQSEQTISLPSGRRSRKLETLIPGEEVETEYGAVYVVTKRYPVDAPRGALSAAHLLDHRPSAIATLHAQFNLHDELHFTNAAFIDTETTGLGGGAGVYAFMVGVGTYEPVTSGEFEAGAPSNLQFVVRQLFMRHPGEEPALLSLLASLLADKNMTITFNGRTFDLPLLRTRYFFNRGLVENSDLPATLDEAGSHLDLLTPARRLWKRRLQSCRLINLESQILGLARSGEDVPGHMIPQLYVDYVNSNDARAMQGVFYHNHEDVLTMVGIATEIYRTVCANEPTVQQNLDGLDWLSLGQIYEAQTEWAAAEHAYRSALSTVSDTHMLNDAFHRLGTMLKRLERWAEATELWERWLTSVATVEVAPYVELAKYHEWRSGDLEQAEMWTQWALHSLRKLPIQQRQPGQNSDLEHRLARIQRKRGSSA